MSEWQRVDFEQLVREVRQPRAGKADLAIWGGVRAENRLSEFLRQWDLSQMPYRIWEYVSEIVFERDTLPQNVALLERGRLFGPGGDLELRRDGGMFAWRFIGPAAVQPPAGDYSAQDYWASHSQVMFHQRKETALLWGKWNGEKWADDRVGAARLNYPATGEWVQVHYQGFSRAGRLEFVWLTGLSEWKEADNG
ncbi:MAG: hypothetical protein JRJ03_10400 [Deltaproteobacteria bacterium]|nr:hypothetical protein [Deltaproteobacteria bacterium]